MRTSSHLKSCLFTHHALQAQDPRWRNFHVCQAPASRQLGGARVTVKNCSGFQPLSAPQETTSVRYRSRIEIYNRFKNLCTYFYVVHYWSGFVSGLRNFVMSSIPAFEIIVCITKNGGDVAILEQPTPIQSQPPRTVMELRNQRKQYVWVVLF